MHLAERTPFAVLLLLLLATHCFAERPDSTNARAIADSIQSVLSKRVVVTGTRNTVRLQDSPVRVEVIGEERIQTTAMVTLADLLREQSGLLMQGTVRTGVQMNGLGPDYTLILIDGQPVIGRVAGVIDLSRISVGNIERVEVVKGPLSSMYGSEALAGVVNIVSKSPPDGFSGSALAQYVTHGPAELRLESGVGTDSLELSGFLNYRNSASFSLPVDTLQIPFAGYRDVTAQLKGQVRLDKHWKVRSWLRYFDTESRGDFIESVFGQIAKNSGSVTQRDFSATLGTEWIKARSRLQITAYGSSYTEQYNFDVDQGAAGTVDDLERRIARIYTQYDYVVGESNRVTAGGEFIYDDIGGTRYADTSNPDAREFYRTYVAFAQWEGLPTDWISYVVSARYDGNSVFGSAISPRFSVLWKPHSHWRFTGSIGTGFKAPDFRQLFVSFSNRLPGAGYDLIGAARLGQVLEPERSVSYDIGVRFDDGLRELSATSAILYSADLRMFRNDLNNLIEFYLYGVVDNRNVYSYRNLSRVTTQGMEVSMTVSLALTNLGAFSLGGGYQFLDTYDDQVVDAISNGTAGTINEPLTRKAYGGLWNRSRHSGTLRLQFDSENKLWSANVRFQFIGRYGDESLDKNGIVLSNPPRKVLDRPDEYVDGYTVINAAVTRSFEWANQSVLVGAGVNNMLDVLNPTLIPGLVGRQLYLQLGYRF